MYFQTLISSGVSIWGCRVIPSLLRQSYIPWSLGFRTVGLQYVSSIRRLANKNIAAGGRVRYLDGLPSNNDYWRVLTLSDVDELEVEVGLAILLFCVFAKTLPK